MSCTCTCERSLRKLERAEAGLNGQASATPKPARFHGEDFHPSSYLVSKTIAGVFCLLIGLCN